MAVEIERKFLLNYFPENLVSDQTDICQGYLLRKKEGIIRIRITGDTAFITIKGPTVNFSRQEYEYPLPIEDAKKMLELFCAQTLIEKTRYNVRFQGFVWEIDRFYGKNQGLMVAEIELDNVHQKFETPDWIGKEVTQDHRYFNSNLIDHPYSEW